MSAPVADNPSARLRARRIIRGLPPVRTYSVLRQVAQHPANHGQRGRAILRALRWQVRSRISSKPMALTVYGGLTLLCYPRSNSASNAIYFTPDYDVEEMRFLRRHLRPGDVFVDAGANIGTYTLLAASLVGEAGQVVAFEPVPTSFSRLHENVAVNNLSQVTLHRAAVGETSGELPINIGSDVSNSVVNLRANSRTVLVDVVRLDDALTGLTPTAIKLDVEGFELAALRGAEALLAEAAPVVLVELIDHLQRRAGASNSAVREWLADRGYRLLRLSDLTPVEQHVADGNYLAVPSGGDGSAHLSRGPE